MKLTLALCSHHLERLARLRWFQVGKRKVFVHKSLENTIAQGHQLVDAVQEFMMPKKSKIEFDLQAVDERPLPLNETHPDYKTDPCYIFGDNNVLLAGLKQAQILTNSVMVRHSLPERLLEKAESLSVPNELHEELQKKILMACVFDAEQKKLPKRKDPLRPAWNFPRDYGISAFRKQELITRYMAYSCEQLEKARDLTLIENAEFALPRDAYGKSIQLELKSEILVTSNNPLQPFESSQVSTDLPDILPMHPTISLEAANFYTKGLFYPVPKDRPSKHCHTAFIHCNPDEVRNLYDAPINADQVAGRLLMKAFCFAAAEAQALGDVEGDLEKPVTVQAVQTDGQFFSFMVYQLNTLEVEGPRRNLFWMDSPMPLYSNCRYNNAQPLLEGYNPSVVGRIAAFLSSR